MLTTTLIVCVTLLAVSLVAAVYFTIKAREDRQLARDLAAQRRPVAPVHKQWREELGQSLIAQAFTNQDRVIEHLIDALKTQYRPATPINPFEPAAPGMNHDQVVAEAKAIAQSLAGNAPSALNMNDPSQFPVARDFSVVGTNGFGPPPPVTTHA